jgi:hypothetical protein
MEKTLIITLSFLICITSLTGQTIERGTVTDIDKNVYKTDIIGKFVWMAENYKTTTLNDGAKIPNITGNSAWYRSMIYSFEEVARDSHPKRMSFSVRCLRDK